MLHQDPALWVGTDAMLGARLLYIPPPSRRRWWQRIGDWMTLSARRLRLWAYRRFHA